MKSEKDQDFPWWLVALCAIGAFLYYQVWVSEIYSQVMATLATGIYVTVYVTLIGYGMALSLIHI